MKIIRNFLLANLLCLLPLLCLAFGWIPDRVKFELDGNSGQVPALVAGDEVLRGQERSGTDRGTLWKFYLGGGMEWKNLVFRLPDGMDASRVGPVRLEKWKLLALEKAGSELEKAEGEWNDYVFRDARFRKIGLADGKIAVGLAAAELLLLGLSVWAAKRHRPEGWKTLLPSVLGVSFALALLMQVALPVQSYVANRSAFPVAPGELGAAVALHFLLAWAAGVACLGVLGRLFGRWVLSLALAFAVCAYLESGILSEGLPSLKGDWTLYTDRARGLKDAAVWCGVFAVFAGLHRWLKPWLGVAGICVAVMALAATVDAKPEKKADTSQLIVHDFDPVGTVLRSVSYSTNRNVMVFIVDSLERETAHAVMEDPEAGPELRERFRGFTEYTNNVGACEHSLSAIANLMTGDYPTSIMEPGFYVSEYSDASVLKNYLESGYAVYMGTEALGYSYTNRRRDRKGNAQAGQSVWTVHSRGNAGWGLTAFCRFRWLPFIAKEPYAVVGTLDRNAARDNTFREKTAYPILMEGGISPEEKGTFLLVHTEGVHIPVLFNRHGERLPAENGSEEGLVEYGIFVLGQLGRLMDNYRERGIFDESLILVLADHGRHLWTSPDGRPDQLFPLNGRPFLWIKPPHCDHPFASSGAPTSHARIAALLAESSKRDLDDDGIQAVLGSEERVYRQQRLSSWYDFHVAADNTWRVEIVAPDEIGNASMRPLRLGRLIPLKYGISEMLDRGDIRFKGFPPQPGGRFLFGWRPAWNPPRQQVSIDFKVDSPAPSFRVRLVGTVSGENGSVPGSCLRFSARGGGTASVGAEARGRREVVLDAVVPDGDGIIEIVGERDDGCGLRFDFSQLEVTETPKRLLNP